MPKLAGLFRKDLVVHGFVTLLAAGVVALIPIWDPLSIVLKTIVVAVLIVLLNIAIALRRARTGVRQLIDLAWGEAGAEASVVLDFLLSPLAATVRVQWTQLINGWLELDVDRLESFGDICFRHCRGKYVGTDRHVPSEFRALYPRYLESESTRRATTGDVRVLLVGIQQLKNDEETRYDDVRMVHASTCAGRATIAESRL